VGRPDCDPVPKQTVAIKSGSIAQVRFSLVPSRATLTKRGETVYQEMIKTVGAAGPSYGSHSAQVAGTLVTHFGKGQSAVWQVVGSLSSEHASIEFVRPREAYRIECDPSGCRSGKKFMPVKVQELASTLKLLMSVQLDRIVQAISGDDLARTALIDLSGRE